MAGKVILAMGLAGVLAGAALAQDTMPPGDEYGPDGPPEMGTIIAQGDGDRITWTTYDFSIGAFAASAWVTRDQDGTGPQRLSLLGYSDPDSHDHRIFIEALVPGYLPGIYAAEVSLVDYDLDQPRQKGVLTLSISAFSRTSADGYYGHLTATAEGQLCSARNTIDCFQVTIAIDTDLQFGS